MSSEEIKIFEDSRNISFRLKDILFENDKVIRCIATDNGNNYEMAIYKQRSDAYSEELRKYIKMNQ